MKLLFSFLFLITLVACDPPGGGGDDNGGGIIKGPNFGRCVSNEEAAELGVDYTCREPGCVCVEDVHGSEHRKEPHCHSDASKCD